MSASIPDVQSQSVSAVDEPRASLISRLSSIPDVALSTTLDGRAPIDLWPIRLKRAANGRPGVVVARPSSTAGAAAVLAAAADVGVHVAIRGRGSNVVGAVDAATDLILSTDGLDRVLAFDPESQLVTVGAGMLGSDLETFLSERDLTCGIYPQSLAISSVGGWVNTRATGTCSARYGGIEHALRGLVVVTASGEVLDFGPRVRAAGGLDGITAFIGTEGSLAVTTEVTLAARRIQNERRVCAGFDSFQAGLSAQRELLQRHIPVDLLRLYNVAETAAILGHDRPVPVLLIATTSGVPELLDPQRAAIEAVLTETGGRLLPDKAGDGWFARRYHAQGLMEQANASIGTIFDTIEISAPWSSVAALAVDLDEELGRISRPFYLHASHVYENGTSLYAMIYLNGIDDAQAERMWADCWARAESIVARHDGVFGHHHGIGAIRARSYAGSDDARLHRALKSYLDPAGTLLAPLLDTGAQDPLMLTLDGRAAAGHAIGDEGSS
jgi:alkyldihydroxyacetonephosphate synthase